MAKKNGIIESKSLEDMWALIYAIDQTHHIMQTIKDVK